MSGYHVEHFGCRAARADGEAVSASLCAAGLDPRSPADADVVVVNTCSVTEEADRAARSFIRRTHRRNPAAQILITGCYAQRASHELAMLPGVAAVVGNSHKALIPHLVERLVTDPGAVPAPSHFISVSKLLLNGHAAENAAAPIWVDDRFAHSFLEDLHLTPGQRTRPNLKIQEGCGNRCTFCVIPQTRGSSRSLPADRVVAQIQEFVAAGGNELVLSGINLGRWGRDLPAAGHQLPSKSGSSQAFAALVLRILAETALPRLRLSSIEPMDWDAALLDILRQFAGTRLARHAHLPLQSGSDSVLRRMHRRYRPWHYEAKVHALVQAAGPDLTLGADIMVGFPGETDSEFHETMDFVRKLPFGYLHLFPFSPRPGTRAWTLHAQNPVPAPVVRDRMAALRSLAATKTLQHRQRFTGRELKAITLQTPPEESSAGRTCGLSENFLPLQLDGHIAPNRLVRVRVTGLDARERLQAIVARDPAPEVQPA